MDGEQCDVIDDVTCDVIRLLLREVIDGEQCDVIDDVT